MFSVISGVCQESCARGYWGREGERNRCPGYRQSKSCDSEAKTGQHYTRACHPVQTACEGIQYRS